MRRRSGRGRPLLLLALGLMVLVVAVSPLLLNAAMVAGMTFSPPKGQWTNSDGNDDDAGQASSLLRLLESNFREKLDVRARAKHVASESGGVHVDEIVYIVTTPKEGPHCSAALVREVIKSAAQLRASCKRCDFDIAIIADPELYVLFSAHEFALRTEHVFDSVRVFRPSGDEAIYAGAKPSALLSQGMEKPFVLFLDSDIYTFDSAIPEVIFDMLHTDVDLVHPYDWAHRHGEAWGRGMPGLCTCFIGYVNTQAVRNLFRLWLDEIVFFNDPVYADARTKFLGAPKPNQDKEPNVRDQELYSLALSKHRLLDVRLHVITQEWVCPNGRYATHQWIDAASKASDDKLIIVKKHQCASIHSHSWGQGRTANKRPHWGTSQLWEWVENIYHVDNTSNPFLLLNYISPEAQANETCGGNVAAYRSRDDKKKRVNESVRRAFEHASKMHGNRRLVRGALVVPAK